MLVPYLYWSTLISNSLARFPETTPGSLKMKNKYLVSLWPSDTLWACPCCVGEFGSSSVQVMAGCHLCTKPSTEPMLTYCQLDPWEWPLVKFKSNTKISAEWNAYENVICKTAAICLGLNLLIEFINYVLHMYPTRIAETFQCWFLLNISFSSCNLSLCLLWKKLNYLCFPD